MTAARRCLAVYIGLVVFSLIGSTLTVMLDVQAEAIARIAGVATIAAACAALFLALAHVGGLRPATIAVALCLVIGAGSEIVGLYTGLPFGRYRYTDAWWPVVALPQGHWFPLLLPFAWLMMATAAYLAVRGRFAGVVACVLSGLLAALADVPMEPVMAGPLGYWRWEDSTWPIGGPLPGGAPLMNFVGWFLTAFAAGLVLHATVPKPSEEGLPEASRLAAVVLAVHVGFTLCLGFVLSMSVP